MSPFIDDGTREQHLIESKGPQSYWVHRFVGDRGNAGRRYSRIVYFTRTQKEAEQFIRDAEQG